MINIIIADDHRIFIDGVKSLLDSQPDMKVVAIALNGNELLQVMKGTKADVILMDINMPELNGINATALIKKQYPETKVLVLSMYKTKEFSTALLHAGASGYLLKNTGLNELVNAIKMVHEGKKLVDDQLATVKEKPRDESEKYTLSKREIEIIKLLAQGLTAPEIGEKIFISHYTVETHRKNLLNKLQLKNTAELIKYAAHLGLLDE